MSDRLAGVVAALRAVEAERDALAERVRHFEALLFDVEWVPTEWRLTRAQSELLNVLALRRGPVSRDQLYAHFYADRADGDLPADRVIQVVISQLRRVLFERGVPVTIENTPGKGWWLDDAGRLFVTQLMQVETGISTQAKGLAG